MDSDMDTDKEELGFELDDSEGTSDTDVVSNSNSDEEGSDGEQDLYPNIKLPELDDTHVTIDSLSNSAINIGLDDLIPTVPCRASELDDTHVTIDTLSNSAINRGLDDLIPTVPRRASELDDSQDTSDTDVVSNSKIEQSEAPRTKTFRKNSTIKSKVTKGYDTPERSASEAPRESTRRNQEKVKRKRNGLSSPSSQASTTSTRNSALPNWATQTRLSKTAAHRSQLDIIEDAIEQAFVKRMRDEEASSNENLARESKSNKSFRREPLKYSAPMSQESQPQEPVKPNRTGKLGTAAAMFGFELSPTPVSNEDRKMIKDLILRRRLREKLAETESSSSNLPSSKFDLSRKRKTVTTGPLHQNDKDEMKKNLGKSTRSVPRSVSDSKQVAQNKVSRNRGNNANTHQELPIQFTSSNHRDQEEESDLDNLTSPFLTTQGKKNRARGQPKYAAPKNQAEISEMKSELEKLLNHKNMLSRSTVREYLDVIGMKPPTAKGIKRVYEGINQYMEIFFDRLCKNASRPSSMYTYKEFEAALKTEGLIGDERLELFCEICLSMNKDQLEKIRGILIPKKGEEDTLD